MRRVPVLLLALTVLLMFPGCSQSPVRPSQSMTGLAPGTTAVQHEQDVPFSGMVTGMLRFDVANPQACAPTLATSGVGATGLSNATGTASHMGEVTYHTEQCLISQEGAPTDVDGKVLVLTAANGDEIHGTFSGHTRMDPVLKKPVVNATFTFNGGTGRFENATGTARMTGVLTPTATPTLFDGRWEWTGTIHY